MKKTNPVTKLEREITRRKRFLTRLVKKLFLFLEKYGVQTRHEVFSYHTHTVRELKCSGLSITGDFGHTQMGGNSLSVWFLGEYVFEVYWQCADFDTEECKLKVFQNTKEWQQALRNLPKEIVNQERSEDEERAENKKMAELKKIARRLHLEV